MPTQRDVNIRIATAPPAMVTVISRQSPFGTAADRQALPYGLTVDEIVSRTIRRAKVIPYVVAHIGDRVVERRHWHLVRPRPGATVYVLPVPQGGGGGNQKAVRTAAMLAVIAAAAATQNYAAAGLVKAGWGVTAAGAAGAAAGGAVGVTSCLMGPLAGVPVPR